MKPALPSGLSIAMPFLAVAAVLSCSDPAPPAPTLEMIALSLDSIAIQWRDSASEVTASPRGALGVELDADLTWRSRNTQVVDLVPNGKVARLIPVRPGTTVVEAAAEGIVATAKVVVLDTAFSVTITATDTMVTMGRAMQVAAVVVAPSGASTQVVWSIANPAVARIDSSQGKNPVFVVSLDTGGTDVRATSAIDRTKFARVRFRTASPVELYFENQPGHSTSPIRANDFLIPGPLVRVRDALGNTFPGQLNLTMAIEPGTGTPGAALFGSPVVNYSAGEALFSSLGVDSSGSGFRLRVTTPGLTATTSAPFTVNAECPGIPYSIGSVVSGSLTTDACQSRENQYYVRYVVTAPSTQLISGRATESARWGVVFRDGTRPGPQSDTTPHLVAQGRYSIRVYSGANGELGTYQLSTKHAFLIKQPIVSQTCWYIQVHMPVEFSEELRCGPGYGFNHFCGTNTATWGSLYRLHLHPNATATITVSSNEIDPCLSVQTSERQLIAVDDNSGGGTTARVVVPSSPNGRNVLITVTGRPPIPASSLFTIRIQP